MPGISLWPNIGICTFLLTRKVKGAYLIHGQVSIHVGHLIGSTGIYGAERWILAQMRYLDPRRTQASIINLIDEPGESSEIVAEAQKRGCAAVDFFTGGRFNPCAALRLADLARQRGISILHSHGYKADMMALMAGRWAGIKVISTPHGWSKENDRKLRLYETVDRLLLKFFDQLCPLSSELYNDLQTAGVKRSKTTLILNGVDIGEIDEAPARPKTDGKRRIGYIG